MKKVTAGVVLVCVFLITILNGCSAAGNIPEGEAVVRYNEDGLSWRITLTGGEYGEAETPPAGLVFQCIISLGGTNWDIFTDPSTGQQWTRDPDGDYHPVIGGVINCAPVMVLSNPGLTMTFTAPVEFSFDDVADTATVSFLLPADAGQNYVAPENMPFDIVEEDMTQLYDGSLWISYSGTISDVLGTMWWMGYKELRFTDPVAGKTVVTWSGDSNVAVIRTQLGDRSIVFPLTNSQD